MNVLVLLHPAMTGAEAQAWCQRHERNLEILHRQGKLHLVVTARPRQPDVLDQLENHVREQQ